MALKSRRVDAAAYLKAVQGSRKIAPARRGEMSQAARRMLDSLAQLGDVAWKHLADVLNIAEQLSTMGLCSDDASVERVARAQEALSEIHQRHGGTGRWEPTGEELHVLEEALWLQDVQLEHCSSREYDQAVERVRQRVQQALRGNAPPGAVVLK